MADSKPQTRSCSIVKSFPATTFQPRIGPFGFYSNNHYQTIIGSEALQQKITGAEYPRTFKTVTERLDTPDGDFLDLDFVHFKDQNRRVTEKVVDTNAIVVMLHGGCGDEENLTPGGYHLGFTRDVDQVCEHLNQMYPDKPIYISGFSLGGNICLKFLGEQGEAAINRNIKGAAVFCVPFDSVECQKKLDQGFNRRVYSNNFLQTLKVKAEKQYLKFGKEKPNFIDIEAIRACSKIGDFDEAFIAKIYGFKDKNDYYVQSSSKQYLKKIRVPVVAINALDDPFVDINSLPTEEKDCGSAPVRLIYTDKGGHCGFLAQNRDELPSHGWIAEELSRVLQHFHASQVVDSEIISEIVLDGIGEKVLLTSEA